MSYYWSVYSEGDNSSFILSVIECLNVFVSADWGEQAGGLCVCGGGWGWGVVRGHRFLTNIFCLVFFPIETECPSSTL